MKLTNKFSIQEVKEFWDKVAPNYESANERVGYVHYQRYEKAIELSNIQNGQTILNIWSRTGNLTPYIRKFKNINLINREVSPEFIKLAQKKFPIEEFKTTDLENLQEFKNNSFDKIISLETLEHTPKPIKYLKELNRILKPGGIITLSLPPKGFEIPTIIWDVFFNNHGEGPHRFLWPKEVKAMLKKANLELIKHIPTIILPLKNDKLEKLSEKILTGIFKKTPLINFGVRHFYVCKKIK